MSAHVLDSAVYGHLWGTPEVVEWFDDEGRLASWLRILRALARAQADLGIIPAAAAAAIDAELEPHRLSLEEVASETRATGHSTLGLIRCLRRVLPDHAREWVYYGATVQDVTDTWVALTFRHIADLLVTDLHRLLTASRELASLHRDTIMCGRTHGQPGLPITFGFKAAVWADEWHRHLTRVEEGRPRWEVVQLGGALGTLEFWGDDGVALRQRFAAHLDLDVTAIPWLTARDRVAEFTTVLALVAGTVAKVGNEIYELQRPELGEVSEPRTAAQVGSITMPHKRNPELSEHLDTLGRVVRAAAGMALEGLVNHHERDGRAWKAEWAFLPEACAAALRATRTCADLLEGLEVHEDRMAANVTAQRGYVLSEPVMRAVAERLGKHVAQEAVQRAAMRGLAAGEDLRSALLADEVVAGVLDPASLDRLLDPHAALGAAGAQVDEVLARTGPS